MALLMHTAAILPLLSAFHLPSSDTTLASNPDITLAAFDGSPDTTFKFVELNDPVMGGESHGTWNVNSTAGFGVMDGEVVNVPSLSAPGFIKAAADGKFTDVSSLVDGSLVLTVRSSTPEYTGYKVSFASGTMSPSYSCAGGGSIPFSRGCFKTNFTVPAGDDFTSILIPFSSFSDKWSPSTGLPTTTCQQDSSVCPSSHALSKISRVEVWAEGVNGAVHLEVQSISASADLPPLSSSVPKITTRPSTTFDSCSAAVQPNLRFGISGRTTPDVPVAVDEGESLAEAVCCDKRAKMFAEPQFLFEAPDVLLFSHLNATGPTTFFDSVCGLPLFRAPVNRSLADFEADSKEHGWPSFRPAEVVSGNVVVDEETGLVSSSCGTHLGSFLPDQQGDRWCVDLSCVAGNPGARA